MTPKFSDDCGLLAIGSWLSLSNAFVFERPYLTFLDLSDKFNPVRKGTKIVTMHQDEILQFNPGSLAWDSSENLYFAVEDWVRSNFVIGKIGFDASGEPVVEWKRVVDSTGFDEGGLGVALTSN